MSGENQKKRIGIIGGGAAGLTTAWLLEKDYNVTLFEENNRLGGHAHTIYVPTDHGPVPIEIGFEFFSDTMFPEYKKLLAALAVPTSKYPMTYIFYNTVTKMKIPIPLINKKRIGWNMLNPRNLFFLKHFGYFVHKGKKIIAQRDTQLTLSHYAEKLGISQGVLNNFIYPMLSAGWGVTTEEFKQFSAYNILYWTYKNKCSGIKPMEWNEVVGGTSAYIKALSESLKNTSIKLEAKIKDIRWINNEYIIEEANGTISKFDYLVCATNAQIAQKLLLNIPETISVRKSLELIDYFHAAIAVHGDTKFMPEKKSDWAVSNIRFDGHHGSLTIYKAHNGGTPPVFRSWIINGEKINLPQPLYAVEHFHHAKVTPNYFKAQEEIALVQGKNNLWFAGLWTHDVDSHNSAIISAIKIGKQLAPNAERLKLLL